MEVYKADFDGNRKWKLPGYRWTWEIYILRVFLSCVHAVGNLLYDLSLFVLLVMISTYASQFLVFISCYIMSYFVDVWSLSSLLEIEFSTIMLVFIVAEIQPKLEKRYRPTWAPQTSCLTEYITNFCYIMLPGSVLVLIMEFQSRFCDESIDESRLTGPVEAFMAIIHRCGVDCGRILESPWTNFQESAPLLLSLCFMVAANFLTKLYVNGKENGVSVLMTWAGLICKLICPIRMVPNKLRLDVIAGKYFFFGLMHELVMFFALVVFPTIIFVGVSTFIQGDSAVVDHFGNWLCVLTVLGFPAVYLASYVDECSITKIRAESDLEHKEIFEKRRLGFVQGGLTCDLVLCLCCLNGILCYFYSISGSDKCRIGYAMGTKVFWNITSQSVQNFLAYITFLVYAAVKMLVASYWVPEPDEIFEKLLWPQDNAYKKYPRDP